MTHQCRVEFVEVARQGPPGPQGTAPNLALPTGFEFTTESSTPVLRLETTNPTTGATGQTDVVVPLASSTVPGFMPKESFAAITQAVTDIAALKGGNRRRPTYTALPETLAQADVQAAWEAAGGGATPTDGDTLISFATATNNYAWSYFTVDVSWHFRGVDTVTVATKTSLGGVLSSEDDGKVFVENNGIMSVIGWDALTTLVDGMKTILDGMVDAEFQIFTENSTWTNNGHKLALVIAVGGGGGGGPRMTQYSGGQNWNWAGQSGGAGGIGVSVVNVASVVSVPVTVGAGGIASVTGDSSAVGGNGGTSSFGSDVSATGGVGGHGYTSLATGSLGGMGSGNVLSVKGEQGVNDTNSSSTTNGKYLTQTGVPGAHGPAGGSGGKGAANQAASGVYALPEPGQAGRVLVIAW